MPGLILEGPDDLNCATLLAAMQNAGLTVHHNSSATNEYRVIVEGHNDHIILSKPFKLGRILDDATQMLRRIHDFPEEIKIGGCSFSAETSTFLKHGGKAVSLTEKECNLLLMLSKTYPNSVPKEVLLEKIWGYQNELETHTLETHIYRLRQKIEDNPAQPQILVTDETGYKLSMVE